VVSAGPKFGSHPVVDIAVEVYEKCIYGGNRQRSRLQEYNMFGDVTGLLVDLDRRVGHHQ